VAALERSLEIAGIDFVQSAVEVKGPYSDCRAGEAQR